MAFTKAQKVVEHVKMRIKAVESRDSQRSVQIKMPCYINRWGRFVRSNVASIFLSKKIAKPSCRSEEDAGKMESVVFCLYKNPSVLYLIGKHRYNKVGQTFKDGYQKNRINKCRCPYACKTV